MPQIKIYQLCLTLHTLNLPDEIMVQIELAQLSISGQPLDLLNLVETQNERE